MQLFLPFWPKFNMWSPAKRRHITPLCLCDSHTYLTYRADLTLSVPRPAMVWWVLASCWELSWWETLCRSTYALTAVLTAVQLLLLRGSSINMLPMKQLYNDIVYYFPEQAAGLTVLAQARTNLVINYAHAMAYIGNSTSISSRCDRCRCWDQSAGWYSKPASKQAQADEVAKAKVGARLEIWS